MTVDKYQFILSIHTFLSSWNLVSCLLSTVVETQTKPGTKLKRIDSEGVRWRQYIHFNAKQGDVIPAVVSAGSSLGCETLQTFHLWPSKNSVKATRAINTAITENSLSKTSLETSAPPKIKKEKYVPS